VQPSIQHVLDGLTGAAAFVHNARLDNLAVNQLGHVLYSDMFSRAAGPGEALILLGSWAATPQPELQDAPDHS
jgi:hypothetical protein